MEKTIIKVEGMTCKHCDMAVTKAVTGAGAAEANVDLAKGEVSVSFDPAKVKLEALKEAISEAGYDVVE